MTEIQMILEHIHDNQEAGQSGEDIRHLLAVIGLLIKELEAAQADRRRCICGTNWVQETSAEQFA